MMLICLLTALGAGIAMPLMFLVFGRLVGDFTAYFTPGSNVTKERFMHGINQNTLYMVYLGIARFFLSYISMITVRVSGLRISARLRLAYLRALFLQPVGSIDQVSAAAVANRLTTDSNTIESGISQQFALGIQAIAFTLGLYIVAFTKSAILTLVATCSVPVVLIAYGIAVPLMYKLWGEAQVVKDQASMLAFEMFGSIRIIVAFGAGAKLSARHGEIMKRVTAIDRKNAPVMGLMMAPMMVAAYAIFALSFWYGIKQYTSGKIDGVNSIVGNVLFSVLWAVLCVYRLYNPMIQMVRAASASAEIFAVIDAKVPDMTGRKDVDINNDIVFRDVSFTYPSRPDALILDKLNVRFEKGKTTAIVGPSGSGKSTIVGLLERWYQPNPIIEETNESPQTEKPLLSDVNNGAASGIFIGTESIDHLDVKWWRSNIGLVQQEPFLFNDTIYSNVSNGLAGTELENVSPEEKRSMVHSACREAYADEFISKLPQGYDTKVGEGGGMMLSGGQRQRIAIARAIIKEPQILILDEATSAIDIRTEKIVQMALDRVSKTRTTIVIAHRLSTIRKADKITVLRGGNVIEEGTHDQLLLNQEGVYTALVRAQAVESGDNTLEDVDDDAITVTNDMSTAGLDQTAVTTASPVGSPVNTASAQAAPKQLGFLRVFTLLVSEQSQHWILFTLTLGAAMAAGTIYPLQAFLFAKVVGVFTLPKDRLRKRGNFWALMFVALAFWAGAGFLLLGWTSTIISTVVASGYRQEYLENIIRQPISFFDSGINSPGTLTARLSIDSIHIQGLLGYEMGMELVGIFGILGSVIISFVFGWKLSLVGVMAVMPIVLIAGYYRVKLESAFEALNAAVFAETAQFGSEAISAFRTVTALIMEDSITNRFDVLLQNHVSTALRKARYSTLVFAFSDSVDMLCQALVFWYGGRLLADREYNTIQFFIIYMAVVQSSMAAGMWFSMAPNIAEATAAGNRILSVRPSKMDNEVREKMPESDSPASVEFKDVNFTYEGRDSPVLHGVNIKIKAGQFAAFVGASGSGKSTLISLLERFYDPSSGCIMVDDIDISKIDAPSYREGLSLVAQESTLYDGTITENVSLSVSSGATEAAVEDACKSAQIHDFVSSLPDGYSTNVGAKGVGLSGGQRQRIALARALLRRPRLLLLDEATSNLDSTSEKQVQQSIESIAGSSTIIAVAHRLATIQKADIIFVLGTGRVLEVGNHAELVSKRGVYYQMCQAQALDQ
ncbi:multidrug resistance protein 2 [Microthyrium microscopicum]|uniref:Multidrug resistance protein 2 n=1 Tax=Microthyrium microscopicum TaxID=703497 RepID=A0A6A6U637_9PEZI|nr:multidrug resistance protein 2 [Microthyrium microscopicum]